MEKEILFYCPDCYKRFKSLSHFNRRRSYCTPIIIADGRKRLAVKKVNGWWEVVKK